MVSSLILYPTTETEIEAGITSNGPNGMYLDLESDGVVISFICYEDFLKRLADEVCAALLDKAQVDSEKS